MPKDPELATQEIVEALNDLAWEVANGRQIRIDEEGLAELVGPAVARPLACLLWNVRSHAAVREDLCAAAGILAEGLCLAAAIAAYGTRYSPAAVADCADQVRTHLRHKAQEA